MLGLVKLADCMGWRLGAGEGRSGIYTRRRKTGAMQGLRGALGSDGKVFYERWMSDFEVFYTP